MVLAMYAEAVGDLFLEFDLPRAIRTSDVGVAYLLFV